MKRIALAMVGLLIFMFFAQASLAENEVKIKLNPMELFHAVMLANGFKMKEPPSTRDNFTAMIYVKEDKGKCFQSACCFDCGSIERILLWAEKEIPLDDFKKLAKRVFDKIIQIHGEDVSSQDFDVLWGNIRQNWKRGGTQSFCWKDAMVIQTEVDGINRKIKIESFNPSEKPNI